VLPQQHLIAQVRELCQADVGLAAALTYGSFAQGQADAYSDIEFWLFFSTGTPKAPDQRAWLARVGAVQHSVVNEFGSHVAFFPGLIRGEFHFTTADDIASVATWPARSAPVDRMIVVDRTGELHRVLESLPEQPALPVTGDQVDEICGRFANWLLLAYHLVCRGESLRAVDALAHARRHLLWMARLGEGRTGHWLTPSRRAEADLSPAAVTALQATVGTVGDLGEALAAMWRYGRELWELLGRRHGVAPPARFLAELSLALGPSHLRHGI
jgi:lincosamide nucleotidyltransferase